MSEKVDRRVLGVQTGGPEGPWCARRQVHKKAEFFTLLLKMSEFSHTILYRSDFGVSNPIL